MTPQQFDTLIDAVTEGETLKAALKLAKTSYRTFALALEKDAAMATRYARARSLSAQFWADKAVEAVEGAKSGEEATIARVKQDVYRWRARVANPKEYGDKVEQETSGQVTVRVVYDAGEAPALAAAPVRALARVVEG